MENESLYIQQYEVGLNGEKDKKRAHDALENIEAFLSENSSVCERAHDYYIQFHNEKEKYLLEAQKVSAEDFRNMLSRLSILVLTVNPIENDIFLHWLYDQNGAKLTCFFVDQLVMTVCSIGGQKTVIHVNACYTGENATRLVLNRVRRIFTPSYIFMLGICYGLNMAKYSIGSVFISNSVATYRLNFRDEPESEETIFEAEEEYNSSPADDLIAKMNSIFSVSVVHSVVSDVLNPTTAKSEIGRFLSSNSLVSSHKVKQAVVAQYSTRKPKPLGGEMEAAGILKSYIVEEDGFNNWMIIKSICDWGEKKNLLDADPDINEKKKDSLQAFAMTNTCGAFERVLRFL